MDHWARFRWHIPLLAVIDWLVGTHPVEQTAGRWREEIETMWEEINSLEGHPGLG